MFQKQGVINGDNVLLYVDGQATAKSQTHTVSVSVETKERSVKPEANLPATAGLFKSRSVTGISVNITASGLNAYNETEAGYKDFASKIFAGARINLELKERESAPAFISGYFIITKLDRTDPAKDDSTYSITLDNDGAVEFNEAGIDVNSVAEPPAVPTITQASNSNSISIATATNGATVMYKKGNATWSNYSGPITATNADNGKVLLAKAILSGKESDVAAHVMSYHS